MSNESKGHGGHGHGHGHKKWHKGPSKKFLDEVVKSGDPATKAFMAKYLKENYPKLHKKYEDKLKVIETKPDDSTQVDKHVDAEKEVDKVNKEGDITPNKGLPPEPTPSDHSAELHNNYHSDADVVQ